CYVLVQVIRGLSGATVVLQTLLEGYVTSQQHLAWPGSPHIQSLEGPGVPRFLTGTNPAAGVEISETVPTGARWALLTVAWSLVTSAAAGTRRSILVFVLAGTGYWRSPSPQSQGAGLTQNYFWSVGLPHETVLLASTPVGGLQPGQNLPETLQFVSVTENFDAADNYGAPVFTLHEWLEAR
ncbi:MAG: hypothetical protein ACRDHY_08000, partial [Anaerolineales bacterium]